MTTEEEHRDAARRRISGQGPVVILRRSDEEVAKTGRLGAEVQPGAIDASIRETPSGDGDAAKELVQ